MGSFQYFPLALPFLLFFLLLVGFLVVLVEIGILRYAYERIGIHPRHIFGLLLLSIFGSSLNIPIATFPAERIHSGEIVRFYGMRYVVPYAHTLPRTVLAVNVGGAVLPLLLSFHLMSRNRIFGRGLLGIIAVSAIVHSLARPVPGVGIAVPTFLPALSSAAVAVILSRRMAAPLAYISGSMGTLVGADLLNLGRIREMGAPVASIGGAGTFDGIFLTGIVAVLLAGMFGGRPSRVED